jgi:hypothetical protein
MDERVTDSKRDADRKPRVLVVDDGAAPHHYIPLPNWMESRGGEQALLGCVSEEAQWSIMAIEVN